MDLHAGLREKRVGLLFNLTFISKLNRIIVMRYKSL